MHAIIDAAADNIGTVAISLIMYFIYLLIKVKRQSKTSCALLRRLVNNSLDDVTRHVACVRLLTCALYK